MISRKVSMSSQERTVITKPERLPRYRRAQRQGGFVLTARDLEILKTVQSYRLATSAHLQALVSGSDQHILRRLQKLFHAGHLDRLTPRPTYREGSAKMVYAITNNGFRELQKAGLIEEPTTTDWNDKNRRIQDLAINHTLLITHVRAVLACACRSACDLRVSFWKEGPQLYDATEV